MTTAGRVALVAVLSMGAVQSPLPGQQGRGSAIRLDDVGSFTFDDREGLPSSAIYDVRRMANGELWIGAATGAYRFDGNQWISVPTPTGLSTLQVRMLAESPDGTRWFATRFEVYREKNGVRRVYGRREGLPYSPIYSVAVSRAFDGEPAVLVGSSAGLFRLTRDDRFAPVALPADFSPAGLMIETQRERAGDESIWLASIETGVARYYRGEWTTWGIREGLHPIVEAVAPGPPGDSVQAVAATYHGAYQLVRGRWTSITAAGVPINRALRVRSGDRYETWLGTFSGRVLRQNGKGWDSLSAGIRRGSSSVFAFRAIDDGVGNLTVYAGFSGGGLARLRTGRAARIAVEGEVINRYVSALRELSEPDGTTSLAVYQVGLGVRRLPRKAIDTFSERVDVFSYLVTGFADARAHGGDLWLGTAQGVYRLRGAQWVRDDAATLPRSRALVATAPLPGGGRGVVASVAGAPLSYRDRGGWHPFPGAPPGALHLISADTVGGEPSLWVRTDSAILRYGYRSGRWTPLTGLSPLEIGAVSAIGTIRLASGEETIWVASAAEGVGHRRASGGDTTWHWINSRTNLAFPQGGVTTLVTAPDGRVYAGTEHGVVTLRPGARSADSVAIDDIHVADDGLPHELVATLALSADPTRVWVGTFEGLGAILRTPRGNERPLPAPRLTARVASEPNIVLADGAELSYADRTVVVEWTLDARHRESATRFRFLFDGQQATREAWSAQRSASLPSLGAGRHVAQLWGMDYRGRVSGPVTFSFTVAPPWWRAPLAWVLYAAAALALLVGVDRWRQAALRRRATELERNERQLAASEERFRRLFDDGADAQLLVRDGVIFDANPAAATLLGGGRRDRLVRVPLAALVPEPIPVYARPPGAPAPEPIAITAITTEGERIPVAARRLSIPTSDAPFDCVELHDLREARRLERERAVLEQQLRESQRLEALGNLAGGVAHDFNNILTVIQGHTELLHRGDPRTPDDEESLHAIRQASDRARGIVRQILAFSHRRPPQRVQVDVGAMLRETGAMLRASIPSTVTVAIHDHGEGARIIGDPTEIHQLLLNLGANAEYAMRETRGGALEFTLDLVPPPTIHPPGEPWRCTRCLRLRVRDTGVGMPPDVQRRIFEPFFTTKPVGEGTGLGLSVLHGIVAAHGGTVTVSSAVGEGTMFELHFPAVEPGEASVGVAPAATVSSTASRHARETILVVDDEVAVASVTALLLEHAGYRVVRCYAPEEALGLVETGTTPIDVVITDQTMPRMTGDVLSQRIHRLAPQVPIIIATGFSQKLLGHDLARHGVVRILEKPFLEDELLSAVAGALTRRP